MKISNYHLFSVLSSHNYLDRPSGIEYSYNMMTAVAYMLLIATVQMLVWLMQDLGFPIIYNVKYL